jgi:hypothetical protein
MTMKRIPKEKLCDRCGKWPKGEPGDPEALGGLCAPCRKKDFEREKVKDLSVRELIWLLKKCPDQDAFVILRGDGTWEQGDMRMIDGVKPKPHHAVVELVPGRKGWD